MAELINPTSPTTHEPNLSAVNRSKYKYYMYIVSNNILFHIFVNVCPFVYANYKIVRTLTWSSSSRGEGGITVGS
jgi:hypothetical protein